MIYWYFGMILRITTRIFFKHIHVSHIKNVPYNMPVILAANHPGAFLDPILLSSIFRKPVHFLVRGDVFKNPVARWFFTKINMIPVYRIDEGFENIGKNIETTRLIAEALKKNGIVIIFCEAYSALDRRLRTVRKGTARIGMQIAKEYDLDVQLIATGISYSAKTNFRKEAIVDFAKPIAIRNYMDDYIHHPQRGFATITRELERRLKVNFVEIPRPECDDLTEYHLNYFRNTRNDPKIPVVIYSRQRLLEERNISERINSLYANNPEVFLTLKNKTLDYEGALQKHKITDAGLVRKPLNPFRLFLLALCFPVFLTGFIFWGIPYLISTAIADKKVTRIDFYDSVAMNAAGLIFGVCVFLLNIALIPSFGWWSLLIWPISTLSGEFAAWIYDEFTLHFQAIRAARYENRGELLVIRKEITGMY